MSFILRLPYCEVQKVGVKLGEWLVGFMGTGALPIKAFALTIPALGHTYGGIFSLITRYRLLTTHLSIIGVACGRALPACWPFLPNLSAKSCASV
jgi:hypothetical protein